MMEYLAVGFWLLLLISPFFILLATYRADCRRWKEEDIRWRQLELEMERYRAKQKELNS